MPPLFGNECQLAARMPAHQQFKCAFRPAKGKRLRYRYDELPLGCQPYQVGPCLISERRTCRDRSTDRLIALLFCATECRNADDARSVRDEYQRHIDGFVCARSVQHRVDAIGSELANPIF